MSSLDLDAVTKAVVKDRLTYLSFDKLLRLQRALKEIEKTEGDILEFGVALGGSGIVLALNKGTSRRFLGFDVFQMIPAPISEKDDAASKARYEAIKSGASKGIGGDKYYGYRDDLFSEVKASFARHGAPVNGHSIVLYRGLFEETWPTASVGPVALAHIDCDWYDPVRFCLHAIADKVSAGGIVIIDDYNDWSGCRNAVDEFIAERKDFVFEDGPNPFLRKMRSTAPNRRDTK
jgi:asparagine synthase (glutamine-hydrolysing)